MAEEIEITVPARTTHLALVRATASALGAHLNLTLDQIMDFHIGIDELGSRLLAVYTEPSTITVTFTVDDSSLGLRATCEGQVRADRQFLNPWSEKILESVFDEFDASTLDGVVNVTASKRRAS